MRTLQQALLAAVKSLLRTSERLHSLFATWYIRLLHDRNVPSSKQWKSPDDFAIHVRHLLGVAVNSASLRKLSLALQGQFKVALMSDPRCMLPSYNHQLPHGQESGKFLALDVGGSTFRVALIELLGPQSEGEGIKIQSLKSYKIDNDVKHLEGLQFFDWLAGKIQDTLSGQDVGEVVLSTGLAWSFPIEQTSLRSGLMQSMGKGFRAADSLIGMDLGDILQEACARKYLNVQLNAIVNDSTATLLSKAYSDRSTRYGLILGTGVNIAFDAPVGTIGLEKFGIRPASWHQVAKSVLVNTELGMFGRDLLPLTAWDIQLNDAHVRPNFQPLEHLTGGRYLGEIARLILLEGIQTAVLFGGAVPSTMEIPYTLDTEFLANIQSSATISEARSIFVAKYPTCAPPSDEDLEVLKTVATSIAKRASAIIAASLHALWSLRSEQNANLDHEEEPSNAEGEANKLKVSESHAAVACAGSVITSYPDFHANCQGFLDDLIEGSVSGRSIRKGQGMKLVFAHESSLLGAAVAVACLDGGCDVEEK